MAFQVETASLELIEVLRPLLPRIKRQDRSLADQLARAASSCSPRQGARMKHGPRCVSPSHGGTAKQARRRRLWRSWTASSPCCGSWRGA